MSHPFMITIIFSILTAVAAILTICMRQRNNHQVDYILKPLTMILILLMAVFRATNHFGMYDIGIIAGLILCLTGDIFLMLPKDHFIHGLASFLVGQLLYIAAFTRGTEWGFTPMILIPTACAGIIFYRMLFTGLGRMKLPVWLYTVIITTMVWQAWEYFYQTPGIFSALAASGAALFFISDAFLSWNRFRKPVRHVHIYVLGTYYAAQWLIAMSVKP